MRSHKRAAVHLRYSPIGPCVADDDAVLHLVQHVHELPLALRRLLQLLLGTPKLERRLLPQLLLPLLRGDALSLELAAALPRLLQLLHSSGCLALQALDLQAKLRHCLSLLALHSQCLDLGLAAGLVKGAVQVDGLAMKLRLACAPSLPLLPHRLRLLGAHVAQTGKLRTLHLGFGLEFLQLPLHCGEALPLLLTLQPENLSFLVDIGALSAQLLLASLQHSAALLGRGQSHAQLGSLLLSRPLSLGGVRQLCVQAPHTRLMLLGMSLVTGAVQVGDMLLNRLAEAVQVLHGLPAYPLDLVAHDLRHLLAHLVYLPVLRVPHILEGALCRLLGEQALVEILHFLLELPSLLLLIFPCVAHLLLQYLDALGVPLAHLQKRTLVLLYTIDAGDVLHSQHLLRKRQGLHRLVSLLSLGADVGDEECACIASQAVPQQHREA
mmetsp:Transcript_68668/g.147123  ORF Transcript_68668/g.147123 Transcript_68668/m.147123 type:complete len:438 (+) Transcript_68668:81-1394(+)